MAKSQQHQQMYSKCVVPLQSVNTKVDDKNVH